MLFRHREVGLAKGLFDNSVRVEVNLPLRIVVRVRPDRQQWSSKIETQNLNIRRGQRRECRRRNTKVTKNRNDEHNLQQDGQT
jgi:hypothetical protein